MFVEVEYSVCAFKASFVIALLFVLFLGFLLPFIAFVKLWIAFITRSSVVVVGCVMYLCLKKTKDSVRDLFDSGSFYKNPMTYVVVW